MLIFLVGMPGSGKSTLATELSKSLNLKKTDLDEEIINLENCSIEDIFQNKGEDYFRHLEMQIVKNACRLKNSIVSTGGGAPCFYNNMEDMNKAGLTIFLDVPTEELVNRISSGDPNRPMVKNKNREEIKEFIESKRMERIPYYSKARLTFKGANITPSEIIETIKKDITF